MAFNWSGGKINCIKMASGCEQHVCRMQTYGNSTETFYRPTTNLKNIGTKHCKTTGKWIL